MRMELSELLNNHQEASGVERAGEEKEWEESLHSKRILHCLIFSQIYTIACNNVCFSSVSGYW